MNGHPNEQALLDYQFDLMPPAKAAEVAAHLAECDACRARAEELRRKLSVLDALKGQPALDESLVSKTLHAARRKSEAPPAIRFPGGAWWLGMATAAAILLMVVRPVFMTKRAAAPVGEPAVPALIVAAPRSAGASAVPAREGAKDGYAFFAGDEKSRAAKSEPPPAATPLALADKAPESESLFRQTPPAPAESPAVAPAAPKPAAAREVSLGMAMTEASLPEPSVAPAPTAPPKAVQALSRGAVAKKALRAGRSLHEEGATAEIVLVAEVQDMSVREADRTPWFDAANRSSVAASDAPVATEVDARGSLKRRPAKPVPVGSIATVPTGARWRISANNTNNAPARAFAAFDLPSTRGSVRADRSGVTITRADSNRVDLDFLVPARSNVAFTCTAE